MKPTIRLSPLAAWLVLAAPTTAQEAAPAAPIARALERLGADVQTYEQHVVTLANPVMEGRVPGSRGMELAREYFEFYLRQAGTQPGFSADENGGKGYRQKFEFGGTMKATRQELSAGDLKFNADIEFTVLGLSATAKAKAPVVFCGYGIEKGVRDYTSFPADEDLTGKIAMVFRFEPMTEEGKSQWARRGPWTRSGNFSTKVRDIVARGAEGIIFVNPPGAADPRANQLTRAGSGGRRRAGTEIPIVHMSNAAAERLLEAVAPAGTTFKQLREAADEAGGVSAFGSVEVSIAAELSREPMVAENVGGVIPGKGVLANEWIVIGGHLDHLGIGLYGARDRNRVGELHPGADDNASGSAAILMLADRLARDYEAMPEDANARSILLVGFDAEEAGLHGSRYYVANPLAPIEQHALMINFDMIGRITNKRLAVSGVQSAKDMEEWLDPLFEASPLEIIRGRGIGGGSDHIPFNGKKVPFLFGIIADFHADYHTPDDVSWKINREDAVHVVELFHRIALTAATRSARFEYQAL